MVGFSCQRVVFEFLFIFDSFFGLGRGAYIEDPHRQPMPPSFLSSPSHVDVLDQQQLYPELMSRQYQGDILILPHDDSRNAITVDSYKWPNGIVPYEFSSAFDDAEEQKKVRKAMDTLESKTCVKFVTRESQPEYISVNRKKEGCYALIGYRPKSGKSLPLNLQSPECLQHQGTIEHELLHVLGLLHEQARPDRDNYVKILWENMDPEYKKDFGKAKKSEVTTFDVPYDYRSVMHYPRNAFSKNGKDTIVAISHRNGLLGLLQGQRDDPHVEMGQRDGATDGDLEKVRRMYKCPGGSN